VGVTDNDTGPPPRDHQENKMEPVYRGVAGIDVHKKMLAVVIRRDQNGQPQYGKRKFGTIRKEIMALAAWLQHKQATEVVMESTAQYWRPVWYGLEPHFKLHLSHPLKTRAPRGRKRDYRDAQRLADRWWAGDLEDSFIPGAEQRGWRWLSRTRMHLKRKMGVIRNQVEGLLEQGGIKLTGVASDVFGVSGWAMLERLAKGETDVDVLADQARGVLRKKKAQLREALAGQLDPIYRLLLRQHMEQVNQLREHVEEINQALTVAQRDHTATLVRLTKIPGVDLYAAQELLAEIGPGAVAFPSAEQFASWVGVCPGSQESAGVCYSHRSAKGNRYLRRLLCQIAWAAVRTKETFFAGLFARLLPRVERKGAAWAVAHRVAKVIWLMLHDGVAYQEKGSAPLNPRTLARKMRRLLQECARAGIDAKSLIATGRSPLSVGGFSGVSARQAGAPAPRPIPILRIRSRGWEARRGPQPPKRTTWAAGRCSSAWRPSALPR
jgi:transposase